MRVSFELIGLIGIILMIACIVLRFWIGVAMGLIGAVGLAIMKGIPFALNTLASAPYTSLNQYTLTVIAMFMLMGMLISESRIGSGLYGCAEAFVGHHRGGLASATVVACGILGAITGGQYGATVIMSKIALPEMEKRGYQDELSTACIAAAAPLAIVIPPSIPLIVYGILTETSIGGLFMGGVLPGILSVIVYCIVITLICIKNPEKGPRGQKRTWKERLHTIRGVLPALILIIVVLVTIYAGICTPTESGALGVVGAFFIALFMKDVSWKMLKKVFISTVRSVGMVMFLLCGTYIFTTFISVSKVPFLVSNFVASLHVSNVVIMIAVCILYFILGMFLPEIPMLLLTVPILWPAIQALGINPIWYGVIVAKVMALGSITPPIGVVAFVLSGASKKPVTTIFKGCVPFIIADVCLTIILCIFPILVTWIPSMM